MLIDSSVIKAVAVCAANKDIRYYLNGVRIQSDGVKAYVISTDGRRMFAYRIHEDIDWIGDTMLKDDTLKMAVSSKSSINVDDEGFITSGARIKHPSANNIGKYPDWRRIIPRGVDTETVSHFNPEYIGDIAKMAKALKIKPHNTRVSPDGDNGAIVTFAGHPCFMVLMPIRTSQVVPKVNLFDIL